MPATRTRMDIDDEVLEFLHLRAVLEDKPIGSVIFSALKLYNWYTHMKDNGGEVYGRTADGQLYKVKSLK